MPLAGSGDQPTVDRLDFGVDDLIDATRDDADLIGVLIGQTQVGAVTGDGLLHRTGEIVPQVPAVGDLDRVRGTGADAF